MIRGTIWYATERGVVNADKKFGKISSRILNKVPLILGTHVWSFSKSYKESLMVNNQRCF